MCQNRVYDISFQRPFYLHCFVAKTSYVVIVNLYKMCPRKEVIVIVTVILFCSPLIGRKPHFLLRPILYLHSTCYPELSNPYEHLHHIPILNVWGHNIFPPILQIWKITMHQRNKKAPYVILLDTNLTYVVLLITWKNKHILYSNNFCYISSDSKMVMIVITFCEGRGCFYFWRDLKSLQ